MSDELHLIRAFRPEDAIVDASSQSTARVALLEHIDRSTGGNRNAQRHRLRRRVLSVRIRGEVVAIALSMLVVAGVGAAFLSVGTERSQRLGGAGVVAHQGPPVIRNFSPGTSPALPGRMVCTAELTRAGAPAGGLFWPETCRSQLPGIGGSPHGTFEANADKVNGVDEYRFLITATGLPPNTGRSAYAVWLSQAAPRGGTVGTYRLPEPRKWQLLGVIEPGVGRDRKLAAEGRVPSRLLGSDYLLLITLQPNRSAASPGQTVLHGFVTLSNAGP